MSEYAAHQRMVKLVAEALGPDLLREVAFVGGCTTGFHRTINSDAACYFVSDNLAAIGLVDASEGPGSQHFASEWAETIVQAAQEVGSTLSTESIVDCLRAAQTTLRDSHLTARASYSLVTISRQTGAAKVFSAGDCLVGLLPPDWQSYDDVRWLSEPHTADNQLNAAGAPNESTSDSQHLITRSINARRFSSPDIESFSIHPGQAILMATDGYWRSCPLDCGVDHPESEDDASRLIITCNSEPFAVHRDTDVANLSSV